MRSRRVTQWTNALLSLLAVGMSSSTALIGERGSERRRAPERRDAASDVEPVRAEDGSLTLLDASGTPVELRAYRRIASGSLLADPVLLQLSAPTDIVAFSARAPLSRDAYRYAGKPSLDPTRRVEQLIALHPDLVLVNSLGEHTWIEQLRGAGMTVFDLGPMWGVQTFRRNVSAIGWLVGRPEVARELSRQFQMRLDAIADALPAGSRRQALYVGVHGNDLYGGTRGSSYHDVLTYAGLVDVAAKQYQGWPSYDPETLLSLDPELIVTQKGMGSVLCQRDELGRLRACGSNGEVIEIDAQLLNDAGLGMLDAAEQIHQAAYLESPHPDAIEPTRSVP
jgi:iron complex transport system substrate-binding protein